MSGNRLLAPLKGAMRIENSVAEARCKQAPKSRTFPQLYQAARKAGPIIRMIIWADRKSVMVAVITGFWRGKEGGIGACFSTFDGQRITTVVISVEALMTDKPQPQTIRQIEKDVGTASSVDPQTKTDGKISLIEFMESLGLSDLDVTRELDRGRDVLDL